MGNILKAIRPLNLLIILSAQILTCYFLGFGNTLADVFNVSHLAIYVITLFCAAFGYLINDIMDTKTDEINRPKANYLSKPFLRKTAIVLSILLSCSAILLAFLNTGLSIFFTFITAFKFSGIIILIVSLLFIYSVLLKQLPLVGNIVVAILCAFSILILVLIDANLNRELLIIFSINAFFIHLIREIIKDAEDIEGDAVAGYKTFPVIAGIKSTRILLLFILFIYILIFTTCVRLMMVKYFSAPLSYVFLTYNVLCIGIPLFHLLSQLQLATEKHDFSYLSKVALYVMITGTLLMLFF